MASSNNRLEKVKPMKSPLDKKKKGYTTRSKRNPSQKTSDGRHPVYGFIQDEVERQIANQYQNDHPADVAFIKQEIARQLGNEDEESSQSSKESPEKEVPIYKTDHYPEGEEVPEEEESFEDEDEEDQPPEDQPDELTRIDDYEKIEAEERKEALLNTFRDKKKELSKRFKDNPEKIEEKWQEFLDKTIPVLDNYSRSHGFKISNDEMEEIQKLSNIKSDIKDKPSITNEESPESLKQDMFDQYYQQKQKVIDGYKDPIEGDKAWARYIKKVRDSIYSYADEIGFKISPDEMYELESNPSENKDIPNIPNIPISTKKPVKKPKESPKQQDDVDNFEDIIGDEEDLPQEPSKLEKAKKDYQEKYGKELPNLKKIGTERIKGGKNPIDATTYELEDASDELKAEAKQIENALKKIKMLKKLTDENKEIIEKATGTELWKTLGFKGVNNIIKIGDSLIEIAKKGDVYKEKSYKKLFDGLSERYPELVDEFIADSEDLMDIIERRPSLRTPKKLDEIKEKSNTFSLKRIFASIIKKIKQFTKMNDEIEKLKLMIEQGE